MRPLLLSLLLLYETISPNELYAIESTVKARAAVKRETLSAFTRAYRRLVLSAESSGQIDKVTADIGDSIQEGEPFTCLDKTYIDLELRSNKAEREVLNIDITYFRKEVNRYSRLLTKNSSTKSQLDSAQRSLDKSISLHKALRIEADILQERRERLCIIAPIGWQVIERHVEPGTWVNAGEPVVEVGDYTRLSAPFALSIVEFHALKEQQQSGIKVTLPELNVKLPARLFRISPAFYEKSRKIHLELELSQGLPIHRGGVRVELALDIPMNTGAVLVPLSALQKRYEQFWLKRTNGSEVSVVYLGRHNGTADGWARVVSPEISPGDQFVVYEE
jgi:RND family efflux transporter MFP subunit